MTDVGREPNTAQLTVWRNLLDAFGQLSAAWDAAADAQQQAEPGAGPGALNITPDLITSFAHAGHRGAEALAGLAEVLQHQPGSTAFDDVVRTQRDAQRAWAGAHRALGPSAE